MKIKKLLNVLMLTAAVSATSFVTSCGEKDPVEPAVTTGTVTGLVTDEAEAPLSGVTVAIGELTATTGADGKYTIEKVDIKTQVVTFTKTDYLTASVTLTAAKFDATTKTATANAMLEYAAAKITGVVIDGQNDKAPLAGVTVSVTETQTATTDAEGKYTISNLKVDAYQLTFVKEGYTDVTKSVTKDMFEDGIATVDCEMGANEVLPGLTVADLADADKWYYNEYRGGRNGDDYPHWDWSVDNMCCLSFMGWWEEQNEGTTIKIQNSADEGHQSNPADLEHFDSYVYGSKMITADNKILTVRIRTHNADEASPAIWGVQVVDLSASEPVAVKMGENVSYGSDDYSSFDFDLSDYVGKEVVVAVGIYRAETGDYWKQVCLRRISFAPSKVEDWNWMPGEEISGLPYAEWKMTKEIVRSTMVIDPVTFNGIATVAGDRDNYCDAYRSWRDNNGIGYFWSLMPVKKDTEPLAGEGFLIKTAGGGTPVSTDAPQAYIYAKLAIASGKDQMTMKVRNFRSDWATFVKVTVIDEDMNVEHIIPTSDKGGEEVGGCWKFINEDGDAGNLEGYLTLTYDLSKFDGQNAVVAVGVYKGEDNGEENKLVIHSIDFK